ncbi:unnamed protein product, partial [Mesorhabditis belari]|uniref:TGF-beta family profile domain-containing protein n=1 Tax=Mesorhabditis belari TaxID=2138241 RepID=A0AAF3EH00_9BILA
MMLPGFHLCSASTILPDNLEDDLDKYVRECAHDTNVNRRYHCVLKKRKLAEMKQGLTYALGIRSGPRRNISISQAHLKQLLLREGFTEDGQYVDGHVHQGDAFILPVQQNPYFFPENEFRTYVDIRNPHGNKIKEAVLNFYVSGITPKHGVAKYQVNLYRFIDDEEIDLEPFESYKRVKETWKSDFWDTIEITDLVKDWDREPSKNYGMMIKIETNGVPKQEEIDPIERESEEMAMYLQVRTFPLAARPRRLVGGNANCTDTMNPDEAGCCLYDFAVDFNSFGWYWVLAPKAYNAYYCTGMCKTGPGHGSTHYDMFVDFLKQRKRCCTPHHLQSMKVIYLDNSDTIQIRDIEQMAVSNCMCV